ASTSASTSSSVVRIESVSMQRGATKKPRFRSPTWSAAAAAASARCAESKSRTASSVKWTFSREPTCVTCAATPLRSIASRRPPAELVRPAVGRVVEEGQRRETGGDGDRVAVERAGVRDAARPAGDDDLHHLGAAADGTDREAAADDLGERRHVGRQAGDPLV